VERFATIVVAEKLEQIRFIAAAKKRSNSFHYVTLVVVDSTLCCHLATAATVAQLRSRKPGAAAPTSKLLSMCMPSKAIAMR
jgi:hypothetical protein